MTPDEKTGSGHRVCPLIADDGNRKLLVAWLDDHPSYETVDQNQDIETADCDICIIDKEAFQDHLDELRAKKSAAAPVLLPYLLLLPEHDAGIIDTDAGELADNVVTEAIDEIVTLPIQQAELHWRLTALLRLREQSVTLRSRERELERQVDLFEKAQDIADVGAWEYDVEAGENWWTEEVHRIYRFPEERTPSPEEGLQYYHPDDRPRVEEAFATAVDEGKPYDIEVRLVDAEDNVKWVRTRGEPQYEAGELTRVRGTIQDITERKERERAIEQARDQYRTLFEASNDAITIIDPEADEILDANSKAIELFGYERETLLNSVAPSEIHEQDINRFREFVDGVFNDGEGWTDELTCTRKGGRQVPAEISASVVEYKGRDCLLASIRDITQRKENERDLRRIKQAVESSATAVYITDVEGNIEYVNPAFEEITGYTEAEVIGETPSVLDSGEMSDEYFEALWDTIRSGDVWEEEITNRRKDGELYRATQTIAPVTDDGDIQAFVAVQNDITEQKEREETLERRTHAIDEAPVGITISDPAQDDNPLIYVNDAFVELTGYSREEVLGKNCRFLQGERTDPAAVNRIRSAIDAEEPVSIDLRNYRKDGTEFWNHLEIAPVRNSDGEVVNYIGFQQDVTGRKERQRQLEILERVLRHNLRNQVGVIRSQAETIQHSTSGEIATSAEQIIDKTAELEALTEKERRITQLLQEDPSLTTIELGDAIGNLVSDIGSKYAEATLSVEKSHNVTVQASQYLPDAIHELVTNAIVHNDSKPEVAISVIQADDTVRIAIADNGPRIPEEERNISTSDAEPTPLYHGSGLGLWLVTLILDRSGGSIAFEENSPTGNIVEIEVPLYNL